MSLNQYIELGLCYNALQLNLIGVDEMMAYFNSLDGSEAPALKDLASYHQLIIFCQSDRCKPTSPNIYLHSIYALSVTPADSSKHALILDILKETLGEELVEILRFICLPCVATTPTQAIITVMARNTLSCCSNKWEKINYVINDWFERIELEYVTASLELIIDYMLRKRDRLPLYWEKTKYKQEQLLKDIFIHRLAPIQPLPLPLIKQLQELFPSLFPPWTQDLTPLTWNLYQRPVIIAGYLLGYPIHLQNPTQAELQSLLLSLSQEGIDNYIALFEEKHKRHLAEINSPLISGDTYEEVNTEDTLQETIYSYSPFDVYYLNEGGKRYYFTRPEFKYLRKNKKNIWTNVKLPLCDLQMIKYRHSLAKDLSLSPSSPLKDILLSLAKSD